MSWPQSSSANDLDALVENQLNLQVKISYLAHHHFMLENGLNSCARVLDVGTGNGAFAARLAHDHPAIAFVGVDKRKNCVEHAHKLCRPNFSVAQVDLFARDGTFDYSKFDGILMRYFLLHVDHSRKILQLFKTKCTRPVKFWIIDLDFSNFTCKPRHQKFDEITKLVQDFCVKTSVHSKAGTGIVPMLEEAGFENISLVASPFTNRNIDLNDLTLYLKQEVLCYSRMIGRDFQDKETLKLTRFIDEELKSGDYEISYGMNLVFAELNS